MFALFVEIFSSVPSYGYGRRFRFDVGYMHACMNAYGRYVLYDNIMYVRSRLFVSDAGDRVISCCIQVMISVRRCLPGIILIAGSEKTSGPFSNIR